VIVFIDTSAFIALLDEDDRHHQQAARDFRWLAMNADLVTHNYVLVETVALARRRFGVAAVARLSDYLFPVVRAIWVDSATHATALAAHRGGGAPSFVDHVSFAVMRQNRVELAFAFDTDFEAQGFRAPSVPETTDMRRVSDVVATYGTAEPQNLVSVTEIAGRARRSTNTVQSWRRRHRDFPTPVAQLAAGPIWSWPAVAEWISSRDRRALAARG
jgi:predicted nucleic acid-binding protein